MESLAAKSSIPRALIQSARTRPAAIAIGDATASVTYRQLHARASAAAELLRGFGVERGDRVLLSAPSTPPFAYAYFGCQLLRAVAVPIDAAAPQSRFELLLELARPRIAFGMRAQIHQSFGHVHDIAAFDLRDEVTDDELVFELPLPTDPAEILFTSGTTGRPKGVTLTHGNLLAAARNINAELGNGADDVEVLPLPLSHSFGLARLRCNVLAGGRVFLTQGFRMPGEIFSALEHAGATGLVGVPAGFAVLLRFGANGLGRYADRLKYVELGSASMPIEHKRQLMELLPRTRICMHYGLTEASRSCFLEFQRDRERLDTIGRPTRSVHVELRDDAGAPVPQGEVGMLWVGGPTVAAGYFEDPERTAASFRDGWVATGDLARADADGFLTLLGRRDDMLNVGGFGTSPLEIEQVLELHPDVAAAACIGVADPRGIVGTAIKACLQSPSNAARRPSNAELAAFVAARLEPHKVPTQWEWVGELPLTTSGKLRRSALR